MSDKEYLDVPVFLRDKDNLIKEQQQAISELVEALEPLSKCPVIIDPNHRHAPYIVSTKLKAKYIQKAVDLVAKYKD